MQNVFLYHLNDNLLRAKSSAVRKNFRIVILSQFLLHSRFVMVYASIILRQLITMMIFIGIGYILCKKNLITEYPAPP